MFALAALAIVAACTPAHTHALQNNTNFTSDVLGRALTFLFGDQDSRWPRKIASCATALGPAKCINAFSVWRADHSLNSFEKYGGCKSSLEDDFKKFSWEKFANTTDDVMEEKLSDSTAKLLQLKSLKMSLIPGYLFELDLRRNGSLNVDVYRKNDQAEESRGMMKKFQKRFYAIVPFLLVPGLIMSAILPFVLPALKMSVMFVGMLNQMAFTGAVFSLLRDNAFNDYYEKKIVYTNKGYKNERHGPVRTVYEEEEPVQVEEYHTHDFDSDFYHDTNSAGSNLHAYRDTDIAGSNHHAYHAIPASNKAYHPVPNDNGGANKYANRKPVKHYAGLNDNSHFHSEASNAAFNEDWSTKISEHTASNNFAGFGDFNHDASHNGFTGLNINPAPLNGVSGVNDFSRHAPINGFSDMEAEPTDDDWINQYYGGEGFSEVIGQNPLPHYQYSNRRISSNKRRKTRLK